MLRRATAGAAVTRAGLALALAAAALLPAPASSARVQGRPVPNTPAARGRGAEGQRAADLGDGTYRNPIFAGDHPDPSVLKDGRDYYITFSSFTSYPGLVLWHSRDLVSWEPVGPALTRYVGSVWAPELVRHAGRYYIYFPGVAADYRSVYVVWADDIRGPWSAPVDLRTRLIDPGHAVGPDGRRYLFLSGGMMAPLAPDGLSLLAPPRKVYDGWRYPATWVVEGFAQEGPKIVRRGGCYYMVLAEGGTAGPPTSHMVIVARSRSVEGPWENAPNNPVIRTWSRDEAWWSKGHASLVEGPDRRWYAVYYAYENGFYTLGRQTLLEPVAWTRDGWLRASGRDVSRPIPKPAGGTAVAHRRPLSDDFSTNRLGTQWAFHTTAAGDTGRARYEQGALVLRARGHDPHDASPLTFVAGDHAYQIDAEVAPGPKAAGGLLLFYDERLYAGLALSARGLTVYRYGAERAVLRADSLHTSGRPVRLRLTNDRHVVTLDWSADGRAWTPLGLGVEVSGYHHNVRGGFLSLRPALLAAGEGEVRFREFRYRALP